MLNRSLAAVLLTVAMFTTAQAQTIPLDGMPGVEVDGHKPNGVFHGNYCGLGDNGLGLPPTDALDEACMHHDACTPSGQTPSCACNARFKEETHAVAVSPSAPDDLKSLATMVEASVPVIPCH